VAEAARLGLESIALTDHDGLFGLGPTGAGAAKGQPWVGHQCSWAELLPRRGTGSNVPASRTRSARTCLLLARDLDGYRR